MDSSIRQNLLDRLLAYLDGGEFLAFSLTPSAIAILQSNKGENIVDSLIEQDVREKVSAGKTVSKLIAIFIAPSALINKIP